MLFLNGSVCVAGLERGFADALDVVFVLRSVRSFEISLFNRIDEQFDKEKQINTKLPNFNKLSDMYFNMNN